MHAINSYLDILESTAREYQKGRDILILEIGVAKGSSTKAFLRGLNNRNFENESGVLYSIDINDTSKRIKQRIDTEKWNFILGDSATIEWDKEIDILFIDGSHTYEAVKKDFEKYEPFVKKNGLIFMHDVLFAKYGVKDYWKEIKYPKVILNFERSGLGIVSKI